MGAVKGTEETPRPLLDCHSVSSASDRAAAEGKRNQSARNNTTSKMIVSVSVQEKVKQTSLCRSDSFFGFCVLGTGQEEVAVQLPVEVERASGVPFADK